MNPVRLARLGMVWIGLWLTALVPLLSAETHAEHCLKRAAPQAYLYTGEQIDPNLGMYYLRARYYQPGIGRFWNMDSYEGSQETSLSLHKYLYCHGNPVNGVDPTGHDFSCISVGSSMGIMTQMGSHELRGGHAALVGARAMFGADGGINDLIAGLDYLNIFDEKVGQVAMGTAGVLGGLKLVNMFRNTMSSTAAKELTVRFMSNLATLTKGIRLGASGSSQDDCAWVAMAFIKAHLKQDFPLSCTGALNRLFVADQFGKQWTAIPSSFNAAQARHAIKQQLLAKGPGASAIVSGENGAIAGATGHAFNAVNEGGKVVFYDLSSSGTMFDGLTGGFKFLVFDAP